MEQKIAIVSFTSNGSKTAGRVLEILETPRNDTVWKGMHVHKPENLKEWCGQQFVESDAILFVGAMGIAVRTIAPFLKSKTTDPAVLVMDERGHNVISVLSGHIGGANELTVCLAEAFGAHPVITTASDVNGKIAVDVFAKKNRLKITDMHKAKDVAAAIVDDQPVSFYCDGEVMGNVPPEISAKPQDGNYHIAVSPFVQQGEQILHLIPQAFVLGIGCRKGKTVEEIETRVIEELQAHQISIDSIGAVATIDLKKDEKGLLEFCEKYNFPITFYSAEELQAINGKYQTSEFVQKITGVDNVCERAAIREAGEENSSLVIEKVGRDGITIALAKKKWSVTFE